MIWNLNLKSSLFMVLFWHFIFLLREALLISKLKLTGKINLTGFSTWSKYRKNFSIDFARIRLLPNHIAPEWLTVYRQSLESCVSLPHSISWGHKDFYCNNSLKYKIWQLPIEQLMQWFSTRGLWQPRVPQDPLKDGGSYEEINR